MPWHQHHVTLPAFPRGFHLITRHVLEAVPEIKEVRVGLLHVFIQHTSASITITPSGEESIMARRIASPSPSLAASASIPWPSSAASSATTPRSASLKGRSRPRLMHPHGSPWHVTGTASQAPPAAPEDPNPRPAWPPS